VFLLGRFPDYVDADDFLAPWLTEDAQGLGTNLKPSRTRSDSYQKEALPYAFNERRGSEASVQEAGQAQAHVLGETG